MENKNYVTKGSTQENFNTDDKYSVTGESEFSRESTIPYDQDEVLSERHYNFTNTPFKGSENLGRDRVRVREHDPRDLPNYRGRGPKGYRRTDEMILADVSEALYRSSIVDATDIEVFVSSGVVTLKGYVQTRDQKKYAESTVEHLAGVEDVYNEIHVRGTKKTEDAKLGRFGLTNNITGLN